MNRIAIKSEGNGRRKPRVGHTRDTWDEGKRRRDRIGLKHARIEGLVSLIATHEAAAVPDLEYIRVLKAKLQSVRHQIKAMIGDDDDV